ncbi:MAG: hypothetical protein NC541_02605 [bacterium]|nr:hypothetical protein [bacterium]
MKHFQEEYRKAVDEELPEFHMDVQTVQDELKHRRMLARQKRRLVTKGCTAAAVFFLLGAGTVAAKNYVSAVIEMRDNGYVVSGSDDAGLKAQRGIPEGGAETTGTGTVLPEEDAVPYGAEAEDAGIMPLEDGCAEEIEIREWEYESLSDFLESSSLASQIPDLKTVEAECQNAHVWVMEDDMTVFLHAAEEGRSFCLRQSDYRGVTGFSTSTVYGGENANERNLTNAQGLNYIVFDTVDENGVIESTHAVIVVEGRELSMDFSGFEPEIIERVLTELNLELYFR